MQRLSLDDPPQLPLLTDTPFTSSTSEFASPPLASSTTSVEQLLPIDFEDQPHPFTHAQNISTDDIHSDPILAKLAKGQGLMRPPPKQTGPPSAFKAKPAPSNMMNRDVGPRMSKAAALRQGLQWDDKKVAGERREVDFGNTPGHKRNNLSLDIASLSRPVMTPRQNRTSQLRSGESSTAIASPIRHTADEISASIRAKAEEDKQRRRQSMTLPPSLSAPSITPRMNRSSVLRSAGGSKPPPTSFDRYLTSTSANNVPATPKRREETLAKPKTPTSATFETKPTPKEEKRRSMMGSIRSLGAPSITPRLNRASMLRAPPSASSSSISGLPIDRSDSPKITRPPPSSFRPSSSAGPSGHARQTSVALSRTSSIRDSATSAGEGMKAASTIGSVTGPRPTRASLLRAGLGAKIQAGR